MCDKEQDWMWTPGQLHHRPLSASAAGTGWIKTHFNTGPGDSCGTTPALSNHGAPLLCL